MRNFNAYRWLISFAIFGLFACKHSSDNPQPAGNNNDPVTENPTDTTITPVVPDTSLCFERDILPIFISNCAKSGCHDAASHQDGYVFTNYETITSKKFEHWDADETELYEKITEDDHDDIMPPPPNTPLTTKQISLIRDWINRGAPNTTDCTADCDTMQFNFASTIQSILNTNCKGCHNSTLQSGGVRLDIYAGVQSVALDGRILGVIRHEPGFPQMPLGGNKLPDCQIRQIEKWVQSGAPDN